MWKLWLFQLYPSTLRRWRFAPEKRFCRLDSNARMKRLGELIPAHPEGIVFIKFASGSGVNWIKCLRFTSLDRLIGSDLVRWSQFGTGFNFSSLGYGIHQGPWIRILTLAKKNYRAFPAQNGNRLDATFSNWKKLFASINSFLVCHFPRNLTEHASKNALFKTGFLLFENFQLKNCRRPYSWGQNMHICQKNTKSSIIDL